MEVPSAPPPPRTFASLRLGPPREGEGRARSLASGSPAAQVDAPRAWPALALAAFVLLSLGPVLLVDIPAMVDYPNHLARMSVLARAGTAAAHPHYEAAWALNPNLAMDLVVPPLARLVGAEAATRLFCLGAQLSLVTGAMALARAAGGSPAGAGFAAALLLYSVPFAWGFLNFEAGLGLALWCLAGWIALGAARPLPRLAVHAAAVAALFAAHLFALGIYGVAIGIVELWRARRDRLPPSRLLGTLALMAAPVAVLAVLAATLGGGVGGERTEWGLAHKPGWLFFLNGFSREASMALSAVLILLGYGTWRAGWVRLAGPGPWIAAGFALLFLAIPFRLRDTAFVDVRVLVAAALILPAFLRVDLPRGRPRLVAAALLGLVAGANLAVAYLAQASYRSDYRAMVASAGLIERGARVLVGHSGDGGDPPADWFDYPLQHLPTLAVHVADAFVPTLFSYPGKQPIATRPEMRHLAPREGGPVPLAWLLAAAEDRPLHDPSPYFAGWPASFDYLYLLGPRVPNPRPDLLLPVAESGRFVLFRIRRDAEGARTTRP